MLKRGLIKTVWGIADLTTEAVHQLIRVLTWLHGHMDHGVHLIEKHGKIHKRKSDGI